MKTLAGATVLALAAWFAFLGAVAFAIEPSAEVIVWAPRADMPLAQAHVALIDAHGGGFMRLRGESPGFVRALYASGAWIVLPASRGGCRARTVRL